MFSSERFFTSLVLFAFPFRCCLPQAHSTGAGVCRKERERKNIFFYIIKRWYFGNYFLFKLLCLWEKHTIWNFLCWKIFFSLSHSFYSLPLGFTEWSKKHFLYTIFYVCIIFNLESVVSCCIAEENSKINSDFFHRHGFVRKRLLISSGVQKSADTFYLKKAKKAFYGVLSGKNIWNKKLFDTNVWIKNNRKNILTIKNIKCVLKCKCESLEIFY